MPDETVILSITLEKEMSHGLVVVAVVVFR